MDLINVLVGYAPLTPAFSLSIEVKVGLKELTPAVVGGLTIGGLSNFLVNEVGIWELPKVCGAPIVVPILGFSFSYLFK